MNRKSSLAWLLTLLVMAAIVFTPAAPALAEDQGMRGEIKFSGVIISVPATVGQPWVIAGVNVAVNAQTNIRLNGGAVAAGLWADVSARRQPDGALLASRIVVLPPEVRLKGPIQAKPADPNGVGVWTIAGQTIAVTADTRISTRGAPLDVGNWAEVFALQPTAGPLTAVRIRGLEAPERPAVELYGAIQSFSLTNWVLSSIPVTVTETTTIMGTPRVGLLAQASAELQEGSNALAAEHIRVMWLDPAQMRRPVQFTGPIEQTPAGNLNGVWQVGGRQVTVDDATIVHQERGPAVVGAQAVVIGWQEGDAVTASQIMVTRGPAWGEDYVRFAGPISALPAGNLQGVWTVGEHQVTVNADTRVEGARFARVNAVAQVGALTQADGSLVAAWVRVLSQGPGPRPSPTP